MNSSAVSPWRCVRWLNLVRSKMTFFPTLKHSSILPRTCAYLPLLASLMLVDVRTSSASSPRQYSKVLIYRSSLSPAIPDAMQNCLKRFGHSSGLLKFNFAGFAVECWPFVLFRLIQPLVTPCGVVAIASGSVTCTQDYYSSQEYTTLISISIHCYKY